MSDSNLLTAKEAAEHLRLKPETLKHWRMYGRGPKFLSLGKRSIRYRREDLEAWVISQQGAKS